MHRWWGEQEVGGGGLVLYVWSHLSVYSAPSLHGKKECRKRGRLGVTALIEKYSWAGSHMDFSGLERGIRYYGLKEDS